MCSRGTSRAGHPTTVTRTPALTQQNVGTQVFWIRIHFLRIRIRFIRIRIKPEI